MRKLMLVVLIMLCVVYAGACMAAGETVRVTPTGKEVLVDRNKDGAVDGVDVYDTNGKVVRRGYDTDGDNYVDRWEKYDENTGMPIVVESDKAFELRF